MVLEVTCSMNEFNRRLTKRKKGQILLLPSDLSTVLMITSLALSTFFALPLAMESSAYLRCRWTFFLASYTKPDIAVSQLCTGLHRVRTEYTYFNPGETKTLADTSREIVHLGCVLGIELELAMHE